MPRVGEVLFFRNSQFLLLYMCLNGFLKIFYGLGTHVGSQNRFNMGSKNDLKIDGFLDRFCKGLGAPKGALVILGTSDLGPREDPSLGGG